MTCMSCRYSEPPRDANGKVVIGQANGARMCKRFPPTPMLVPVQSGVGVQYVWPMMGLMDSCGEFRSSANGHEAVAIEDAPAREAMS